MSKNSDQFYQNILQSNKDLYLKDDLSKCLDDIKKDLKTMSQKLDRIYSILVNLINDKDF